MAKRKLRPWKDLSPSYQKRLRGAGITPEMRRRGADLRAARSHPLRLPYTAPAPLQGVTQPTTAQRAERRAWREASAPGWLPNRQRMGDATAIALSALRPPRDWKAVHFTPAPAGQSWSMTVDYVRGHPQTILLPPDTYREVIDLLTFAGRLEGYVGDDAAWARYDERGRDFDVAGTP